MSIGSFLATASDVQTGMLAGRERLRQDRAQQLAMEELNRRNEERRLLQAESTRLAGLLPQEAGVLGINADISQQAGVLPAYVEPTLIAPPGATAGLTQTPPPAGGGAGAGTKTKKVSSAATKAPRFLQIEGATIQPWDMKRPDRLDTAGVAGFERIDPNASNATKLLISTRNENALKFALSELSKANSALLGAVRKQFVPQDQKRAMEERQAAATWYATSDAKDYFRRNPEMLAVAQKNPTNFYGALVENNRRVRESVKAPTAAPATPTPQEVTPTTSAAGGIPAPQSKMIGRFPQSYKDPQYDWADQRAADKVGVDVNLIRAIRLAGERTNADKVSSAGARTPYQFTPGTRAGMIKNHGVDPWASPMLAAEAAALHLKESLDRGMSPEDALREYHGGPNRAGWGEENQKYAKRTMAFLGGATGEATGGATGVQQAGVSLGAAPKEKRLNLNNINTYLTRSDKLPQSVTYVNAQRQFALAKAQAAARTGNIAGYEAAVTQLKEYEGDLTRLMGAQAMVDIQNFNDPRRASQLISYLSGGQLELRMREDGSFAYFGRNAQGQPVALPGRENVGRGDVIETLRRASDEMYRKTRSDAEIAAGQAAAELAGKIELEVAKGQIQGEIEQFKGGVDLNKAIIQARAQLAAARLRGQNTASVAVGDENWVTYTDPATGEQLLARPTEVTLPSGQTTVTLDAKPLSQWGGGGTQ